MKFCRTLLLIAIVALAATACKSTKNVTTATSGPTPGYNNTPKINYAKKVLSNIADTKVLTAKMKVNLAMGEKTVSLSGTMRMKRGDVIQLSMTFPLVGEVCRMEFTANEVLIVDRINDILLPADQLRRFITNLAVKAEEYQKTVIILGKFNEDSRLGDMQSMAEIMLHVEADQNTTMFELCQIYHKHCTKRFKPITISIG